MQSILTINGGSSSIKFAPYKTGEPPERKLYGKVDRIGLSDKGLDALFTTDKPVNFAFHGHPLLIHRLTYRLTNHKNLHVRGFKEEGTTSTPFDIVVLNDLDRFHLVADVIDRVSALGPRAAYTKQAIRDKLIEHRDYICKRGEDMPAIRNWKRKSE